MLQNTKVGTFTFSEVLRENQQRGKIILPIAPPAPPPPTQIRVKIPLVKINLLSNYWIPLQKLLFCKYWKILKHTMHNINYIHSKPWSSHFVHDRVQLSFQKWWGKKEAKTSHNMLLLKTASLQRSKRVQILAAWTFSQVSLLQPLNLRNSNI